MHEVNNELAAMQAVASALSSLANGESRNRVLRWATEHFGAELVPTILSAKTAHSVVDAVQVQQGVDPENLDALFEDGAAPRAAAPVVRPGKPSVTATISSFVADFQKLAHDWQNA